MTRSLASLGLCLLCGPCITVETSRTYNVWGDQPTVTTTVTKDEVVSPQIEGKVTGMEAKVK